MTIRKTTKTKTKTTGKGAASRKGNKTPLGNVRAIDDNFVAPKRKPKDEEVVTLAEAKAQQAAEDGLTVDEVTEQLAAPKAEDRPVRPAGTSNLANTIRSHRGNYAVMLRGDKKTQNNGDTIAVLLLDVPLEKLRAFSATKFGGKSYEHLNPGHARMCIGNLIRGALNKDEAILPELYALMPPKAKDDAEAAE